MKAKKTSLYLFIWAFFALAFSSSAQTQKQFSAQEMKADFEMLKIVLEGSHINPYAFTSQEELDEAFNEAMESIDQKTLSALEANKLFQSYVSKINNGHTSLNFPVASYLTYGQNGGTLFPLELVFEDEKVYIRKDWSKEQSLPAPSEILSINGLSMAEVLLEIYPQVSAERHYFKNAKIEFLSLPRYYWLTFGQQETFEIEYEVNGIQGEVKLQAIKVFEEYENLRTEIYSAPMSFRFIDEIGFLRPGKLGGDQMKFNAFVDSAFAVMLEQNTSTLIIDLRNNPGGDDSFSSYLVSFLAEEPFNWCSNFTLKTSPVLKQHVRQTYDTTQALWQATLRHKDGEIFPYEFEPVDPQPQEKRFTGEVYVLVNRQSHSQSAVAASQLQDMNLATVVGEETGEYPTLYASIFPFTLLNTGESMSISKGRIVRLNGSEALEGVIPDILIRDHLLDEDDEILSGLLDLINQ